MKERPILFSAPMVRALLNGTKTQTRRVARLNPNHLGTPLAPNELAHGIPLRSSPYGQPGDRLWVREAWRADRQLDAYAPRDLDRRFTAIGYEAGSTTLQLAEPGKLRPGMFMPRWASRITLEVIGVRVERLQDISETDARAEGAAAHNSPAAILTGYRQGYRLLWDSINGAGAWERNCWVWVVEFRRLP